MTDRSYPRSSLTLALIVAVVIWPFFLLLALDIYGFHGWLRECLFWHEPLGLGVLAVLVCASASVLTCLLINVRRSIRLGRNIRKLPPLDEAKTAALRKSLPDLEQIALVMTEFLFLPVQAPGSPDRHFPPRDFYPGCDGCVMVLISQCKPVHGGNS